MFLIGNEFDSQEDASLVRRSFLRREKAYLIVVYSQGGGAKESNFILSKNLATVISKGNFNSISKENFYF